MPERIMFMRHLQDQDNLFYQNNSPVLPHELNRAGDIAREIAINAKQAGFDHIHFITSSKSRAAMTANEISNRARLYVNTSLEYDERIRELDQGKYVLPKDYKPGDNFQPLKDAWLIFFDETFKSENLWYRFGNPVQTNNGLKYPELAKYFKEYGENQIEFSIRYYSFLSNLYQRFRDKSSVLPVIVTHQALTARFFELSHIAVTRKVVSRGSLPLMEWSAFQEIKDRDGLSLDYGGIANMDLATIGNLVETLDSEVNFLKILREKEAYE